MCHVDCHCLLCNGLGCGCCSETPSGVGRDELPFFLLQKAEQEASAWLQDVGQVHGTGGFCHCGFCGVIP